MKGRSLLAAAIAMAVPVSVQASDKSRNSTVVYWSVWTDKAGVSHQARCELNSLKLEEFSVKGASEWVSHNDLDTSRYVFNIMPANWRGEWHKNPQAQWIIPLAGRWYVETMDGTKVEMGPGEISFGFDRDAKEVDGKIGHISGAAGKEPATVFVVQTKGPPESIKDERCPAGGAAIAN